MYGRGQYTGRKAAAKVALTLGILLIMAGTAMWAYNLGSMAYYGKDQARAYMINHCELLSNPQNPNDRWFECEE